MIEVTTPKHKTEDMTMPTISLVDSLAPGSVQKYLPVQVRAVVNGDGTQGAVKIQVVGAEDDAATFTSAYGWSMDAMVPGAVAAAIMAAPAVLPSLHPASAGSVLYAAGRARITKAENGANVLSLQIADVPADKANRPWGYALTVGVNVDQAPANVAGLVAALAKYVS